MAMFSHPAWWPFVFLSSTLATEPLPKIIRMAVPKNSAASLVKREYSTASSFLSTASQTWLTAHGLWMIGFLSCSRRLNFAGCESKRRDCTLYPLTNGDTGGLNGRIPVDSHPALPCTLGCSHVEPIGITRDTPYATRRFASQRVLSIVITRLKK